MLVCDQCKGTHPPVAVSPDYKAESHGEFVAQARVVRFTLDDDELFEYLLSPPFMKAEGILPGSVEMPDPLPAWVDRISYQCRPCFEKRR